MIRSCRVTKGGLTPWFIEEKNGGGSYTLRVLTEQAQGRTSVWAALRAYVQEAHEDARRKLRAALAPDLSPFNNPIDDPTYGYPHDLHISTLMGYFGEVLAGIAAEHTDVHGASSWKVPAFPFRFHQVAFQKLEDRRALLLQQTAANDVDDSGAIIPGRTGSDVLAFLRGPDGELIRVMVCEAKCLATHNAGKLLNAHAQLSSPLVCPSGVRDLIELLADYDETPAREWREQLLRFRLTPSMSVSRVDVVVYATGNHPAGIRGRKSWASAQAPSPRYKGARPLEVVEVHLADPLSLVRSLYRD